MKSEHRVLAPRLLGVTVLPHRNLDMLRAMAVVSVCASHLYQSVRQQAGQGRLGRIGVFAFFVHTALVLMSSIERSGGARAGWVRRFYLRRAARIYPLAWVTIALCVATALPVFPVASSLPTPMAMLLPMRTIVANAFLVQNIFGIADVSGPLWTLPLEVQMYVLLPVAYLIAQRGRGVTIGTLIITIAASVDVASVSGPIFWRLTVFSFAPCFMAGVAAYAWLRRSSAPRHESRIPASLWPAMLIATAAIVFRWAMFLPAAWLFSFVLAALIVLTRDMQASPMTKVAQVIAKYSYGVYLLHIPAWLLAFRVQAPVVVQCAIYVILLVSMPVAAYHLVEAPLIRWAHDRTREQVIIPTTLPSPRRSAA